MKSISAILILLFTYALCWGFDQLSQKEKTFIGKWYGSSETMKWEIKRNNDRTFEMVLKQELKEKHYKNYITGTWKILGDNYIYEWHTCQPADCELHACKERIKEMTRVKIITISMDTFHEDEIKINYERRVNHFKFKEWEDVKINKE